MTILIHKFIYCDVCKCYTTICGNCGLNACSGGANCEHCEDSYNLMMDYYKSGHNTPDEFLKTKDVS